MELLSLTIGGRDYTAYTVNRRLSVLPGNTYWDRQYIVSGKYTESDVRARLWATESKQVRYPPLRAALFRRKPLSRRSPQWPNIQEPPRGCAFRRQIHGGGGEGGFDRGYPPRTSSPPVLHHASTDVNTCAASSVISSRIVRVLDRFRYRRA